MTIYQRIKDLANQKNISIRELESTLGFANGTVSKWQDRANTEKLQKVAIFFGVPIDSLLKESDDPISYYRIDTNGLNKEEIGDMKKQLDTYTEFLKSQIQKNRNNNS
ncbi:helix-turn-helix domain-containing protein [Lactiplantibacillus carotarum]|uniref:helix-turn-helix domain-containing protein n=1 Tax=Lactiplantibacillus carotarum TaxID=2993456 RepID=UPI00298EE840|nr:helix-turn-helix transcriptional regulator [Lactiplantibacillus carotarum]